MATAADGELPDAPAAGHESVSDSGTGIRISRDVDLFILDDSGIFFTGHGLQTFNTPATYVWCCLQEKQELDEITTGYAEAFGVSADDASGFITGLLHRWQGLGYLSGVDVAAPGEIDFTTALGRLLSNSSLRKAFADDPEATVRRLSVSATDREALLSIEPGKLERQAQMLKAKIAAFRPTARPRHNPATASALGRLRSRGPARPATVGHYRLLNSVIRLDCEPAAVTKQLQRLLEPIEVAARTTVEKVLSVIEQAHGCILEEDGQPFARCSPEEAVPMTVTSLRGIALDACSCLLRVHAGAIATGSGQSVFFPAVKWQDRTALITALAGSGFGYLSDETSPLISSSLHTRAVPVPPVIRKEDMPRLSRYYPDLPAMPAYRDQAGLEIRLLPVPAGPVDPDADFPVRWVIFPDHTPTGETALQPLGRTEALQRLLQCAVSPRPLEKQDAADLVCWMRDVDCYELTFSSLPEAVETVTSLCG